MVVVKIALPIFYSIGPRRFNDEIMYEIIRIDESNDKKRGMMCIWSRQDHRNPNERVLNDDKVTFLPKHFLVDRLCDN